MPLRPRQLLNRLPGAPPLASGDSSDLARAGMWSTLLRVAGMAASFLLGVLLARYLTPAGLGTYGIIVAGAMFLGVTAQAGLPMLAVRELSVAMHHADWGLARGVLFWFGPIVLGLSLIAAVVLVIGAALWASRVDSAGTSEALWGAALIPMFALTALVSAELRALGRMTAGQSLEVFVRPVLMSALCLAAFLSLGGLTVGLALQINAAAALVTLIVGLVLRRRSVPIDVRNARPLRQGRRWLRAAIPLAWVDTLKQIDASYGLMILGALLANVEAGYLRVALSTIVFVVLPQSVIHVVLAPTLARLSASSQRVELQALLTGSARLMFFITLAFLVVLLAFGRPLLIIVFGAEYAAAWLPLVLLTSAQLINGFFGVGWVLLSMSGGEQQLTKSYLVSVPLGIAAAVPLCAVAGAAGAAAAALLGTTVQNLLAWRYVYAHLGVDSSILLRARPTHYAHGDEQAEQVR